MKRLEEPSIIYEKKKQFLIYLVKCYHYWKKIGRVSVEESVEELVVHHPLKSSLYFFKKN